MRARARDTDKWKCHLSAADTCTARRSGDNNAAQREQYKPMTQPLLFLSFLPLQFSSVRPVRPFNSFIILSIAVFLSEVSNGKLTTALFLRVWYISPAFFTLRIFFNVLSINLIITKDTDAKPKRFSFVNNPSKHFLALTLNPVSNYYQILIWQKFIKSILNI